MDRHNNYLQNPRKFYVTDLIKVEVGLVNCNLGKRRN